MATTTLKLQNEANILSEGKKRTGNAKPVICIETGEVYNSVTDAAEKNGTRVDYMSSHLRSKTKTLHKKHFIYMSKATENLDTLTTHIREMNKNYAELEFKAKAYDAWMAEQQAKQKKQAKIDVLMAKKAKHEEKDQREAELIMAIDNEIQVLKAGIVT